jgi:hypothetical protein
MRKILMLAVVALMVTSAPGALAAGGSWHRDVTHGGLAAVSTTPGGLSAVTGRLGVADGKGRFLLAVYGGAGVRRWARTWQPLDDSMTFGTAVDVAPDGRVIAGGEALRPYRFPESPGWFVRVYGPGGRLLWERTAPGWRYGQASSGTSGVADSFGGVLVSGWTCGESGCDGGWVRAFSPSGTPRWTQDVGGRYGQTTDVDVAPTGHVYVGGGHDVLDPMDGNAKAYVSALTSSGSLRWTRVFGSLGSRAETKAVAVTDHLLVVGGRARGYGVGEPWGYRPYAWLAALGPDGSLRWMHTWGHDRASAQEVNDVAIGPNGGIKAVGSARRPDGSIALFIRTYRPTGELVGTRLIDPAEVDAAGTGISSDPLGTSVVGGYGNVGRLWRFPSSRERA